MPLSIFTFPTRRAFVARDRATHSGAVHSPAGPTELLTPEDILLEVEAADAADLWRQVARHWAPSDELQAREIETALAAREARGTTALGRGVAIPHARLSSISTPRLALVRLRRPLDFGAADGEPVQLLFVLLVPAQAVEQHLNLIARLAGILGDSQRRERLLQAKDAAAVSSLLRGA